MFANDEAVLDPLARGLGGDAHAPLDECPEGDGDDEPDRSLEPPCCQK
jgi:hypothetical protein